MVLSDDDIGVIIFGLDNLKAHTPECIASKILDKYVEKLLMTGFKDN